MAYASASECKAFSAQAAVAAKSDAAIEALIARAETLVNAFTGNDFNISAETTIKLDGSGSRRLVLPDRLASLAEVRFLNLDDGGAKVLSSTENKDVFNKNWWLVSDWVFPVGFENISVKGTFGYSTVPQEIKDSVCALVERMVLNESDGTAISGLYDRERIGDYEYELRGTSGSAAKTTLAEKIFPDTARLLMEKFRRPILAKAVRRLNSSSLPRRKIRED